MDLNDISDADFYERQEHYKNRWCNDKSTWDEKVLAEKHGNVEASAEMLNEIHVMLQELIKRSNP